MVIDVILFIILLCSLFVSLLQILPSSIMQSSLMVIGIIATVPVGISAIRALIRKKITVDLLATIALVVSLWYGEWLSVVFLNLMITSARIFGAYTEGKARSIIKKLLKLRPEMVKVKTKDGIKERRIEDVVVGDLIIVESGDRVPVDGIIETGDASIDQSTLTGESIPIVKTKGEKVLSSTLTIGGSLAVRVTGVGKDTEFEKIIRLVEEAQNKKVGIQTTADVFASWYIMIIFVGAGLLYFFLRDISLVLSVLLVTCADDLAVAIPIAFWAALGYAAKRGIIIKGTNFLEGLTKIKLLIVDKTGTLTLGHVVVQKIGVMPGYTSAMVLRIAATSAQISKHPISKAIVNVAMKKKIKLHDVTKQFHEYPGKGIIATIDGKKVIVGNISFQEGEKVRFTHEQKEAFIQLEKDGYTTVVVSQSGKPVGSIMLSDKLRPQIKESLDDLRTLGITNIVMLTGDNKYVASHVAKEVGVDTYHAGMLPEEKVAFINEARKGKELFAMVGDGVNDAPALVGADIGIAMGAIGSDAAIEASDIALMNDDMGKIPEAVRIGKETLTVAYQNFFIWGIINAIGLVLVFGGVLKPEGAAAYNFITDFLPLMNSSRLFWSKLSPLSKHTQKAYT